MITLVTMEEEKRRGGEKNGHNDSNIHSKTGQIIHRTQT